MSTVKKTPATRRRSPKSASVPPPCDTCAGTGETATTVRVGRKSREIEATQTALCLDCFGTGTT
ncbi:MULTISPECIES: hypothetical protein [unclassified Streptomyces]|uniref:hypothetical protein n=1 Tax=unclassified Streptomyces TaxID=2593676 RepID=UPI0006F8D86E|nr:MULTISPECIES: hypothetical protein [unclassified Streptomyces]KQX52648.1 hypothetical protein ASD33_05040 [Streptomyces sp. Root1304]KRA89562.1 hypothetical protein ASE09_05045 [Streptomyces sp. Root66D1]